MTDITILKPMTADEARTCITEFNHNLNNARVLLLDLYEREGWRALGYENWRACVQAEFLQSQANLYRLLEAARIERHISPIGEIGIIPESHLRPLHSFDSQTQRDIWDRAKETAPDGKVTASHIEQVSREFKSTQEEIVFHSFEDWSSNPNPPYEVEDLPDPTPEPAPLQSQSMGLLTKSENDSWRTPSKYIEAARLVLGGIDLDPASSAIANETVRAKRFLTKEENGLSLPWYGTVFCNPPYGKTNNQSNQGLFAHHLIQDYMDHRVSAGIILVNLYFGYGWFAPLRTYPMCLVDHRISFIDPSTDEEGDEAKASSVFIYVGENPERFRKIFRQFGPFAWPSYSEF